MTDGPLGRLSVCLVRATGLPDKALFGIQDPYVVVRFGEAVAKTDTHKDGGTSPVWEQTLCFDVDDQNRTSALQIVVKNNNFLKNDVIGEGRAELEEVFETNKLETDVPITTKDGRRKGTVTIVVEYKPGARTCGVDADERPDIQPYQLRAGISSQLYDEHIGNSASMGGLEVVHGLRAYGAMESASSVDGALAQQQSVSTSVQCSVADEVAVRSENHDDGGSGFNGDVQPATAADDTVGTAPLLHPPPLVPQVAQPSPRNMRMPSPRYPPVKYTPGTRPTDVTTTLEGSLRGRGGSSIPGNGYPSPRFGPE